MALEDKLVLLVDSHNGIYIPQTFCRNFLSNCKDLESNLNELEDEFSICLDPDHEDYWDRWIRIEDDFWWVENGIKYRLLHSEDLWAVHYDLTEEEELELENWN